MTTEEQSIEADPMLQGAPVDHVIPVVRPAQVPHFEDWSWAVVEIMGGRSHAGRVREEQRLGAIWLRIDVPIKGDPAAHGWATHFYAPAAIFSISPSDEAACLRRGRPYDALVIYSTPDVEDPDV